MDHTNFIDYKSTERFGRYISDRGRIEPRRKTGTCAWHQRMLATAIKRARHVALLPFTQDHIRISGVMAPRPAPMRAPWHGPPPPRMGEPEPAVAPPAAEAETNGAAAEAQPEEAATAVTQA